MQIDYGNFFENKYMQIRITNTMGHGYRSFSFIYSNLNTLEMCRLRFVQISRTKMGIELQHVIGIYNKLERFIINVSKNTNKYSIFFR